MQGTGTKEAFAGLGEEYARLETSDIVIVPAPFDKTTTYCHGTDRGPKALIEASRNMELYDIETAFEVYQKGIFTNPAIKAEDSLELLEKLYQEIYSLLQQEKFVVTLGGEHAISLAPIRAHAQHFGPISVLQLDAHSDLISAYEGNPYSHASIMARVLELEQIESLVAVGVRSMCSEEVPSLSSTKTFFAHDLFHNDLWMRQAVSELSENVYITFDLDVFDSSVMPATGTPEPGGLFWHQVMPFLHLVAKQRNIIGFDVVELCPIPNIAAPDFLAAKLVYKLLSYIFKQRER